MLTASTYSSSNSTYHKWMITITIMLVAMIEVLDMTIVNVSLPAMMGSLGATSDQITWVLTSYIVSSAVFMLLTGFLVDHFGIKRLLIYNILGFMLASALCGLATSLSAMVVFRTLQGIFGAGLVPLSQTVLRKTFPAEDQGKAMAIWGVGVMVAPILGPTLGGLITEYWNWRFVFYINIPVCLLSWVLALYFIEDTPYQKKAVDWLGMMLLSLGIGCLQLFLDRGNHDNWFQSNIITFIAITSLVSLLFFIIRSRRLSNPIINLQIFSNRNFTITNIILLIFCLSLFSIISTQPLLLENYLGFPTKFTGLLMAPRGIAAMIAMMIVGNVIKKIDSRIMMVIGLIFVIIGTAMMTHYNLTTPAWYWMWSGCIQGFGMGFFFVPLATLSLSTLPQNQIAQASGLFSFSRNLGTSIGISIMSTLVSRETQINWNQLIVYINPYNKNLQMWLHHRGWDLHNHLAIATLQQQLSLQSGMIAFIDTFKLISIVLVLLIPLIVFVKKNV